MSLEDLQGVLGGGPSLYSQSRPKLVARLVAEVVRGVGGLKDEMRRQVGEGGGCLESPQKEMKTLLAQVTHP